MINPFEAVAVLLGVAYILLILKRNRWGWVAGAGSSMILAVLAERSRLPMQALLQLAYVAIAVYGWFSWKPEEEAQRVGTWPWQRHLIAIAVCLAVSYGMSRLPVMREHSDWPFLDMLVTCVGLLASWMVARVYLENWLYWIVIDSLTVFLFIKQDLGFTATLFVAYLVISCLGFRTWLMTYRRQTAKA
ncbi:MAG: nicotinamide riboside transporter PnuC [Pseudomonadota bacterium]